MVQPAAESLLLSEKGEWSKSCAFQLGREIWQAWEEQAIGVGLPTAALVRAAIVQELINLGRVDGSAVNLDWAGKARPKQVDLSTITPATRSVKMPPKLVDALEAVAIDNKVTVHGWVRTLSRKRFGKKISPDHRKVA
jgi:hypothetical protein